MSKPAVILELGSYHCLGGFGGEEAPKVVFLTETVAKDVFSARTVKNFDNYKLLAKAMYEKLGVDPSEQPVFICDGPMSSLETRQKIAKFFFEELNVPSIYIAPSFVYASLTASYSDALIIDMGESSTEIAAVSEGQFVKSSVTRHIVTGKIISNFLMKTFHVTREQADKIKAEVLQVPDDFDREAEEAKPVDFEGVSLGQERVFASELYFKPYLDEIDSDGLPADIKAAINHAPMNSRKALWQRIILFGGAAKIKGLAPRLQKELAELAPPTLKSSIHVTLAEDADSFAWIGASAYASAHEEAGVSNKDYQEIGPSIIQTQLMN